MATPRTIPAGARAVAGCLTSLLLVLLLPTAGYAAPRTPADRSPAERSAVAPTEPLDTTDRAAVAAAYTDGYLPAAAVTAPAPASDAASSCAAGASSAPLQDATLTLVNYVRRMTGVPTVSFSSTYSASAQQAALMMYANGALSANPPSTWRCWTDAGRDGAANSNLSDSSPGAAVVKQYMDESGAGHVGVVRRAQLQRPNVQFMGSGTVGSYNALWVRTTRGVVDAPEYTSWPSSGYFPAPLEPAGRWSVTTWNADTNLRAATVRVTGPDGRALTVTPHPVDTNAKSLVFEVGALPVPTAGRADTYTVTVSGIANKWGDTLDDYTYAVRLFDPASDAPPPVQIAPVSAPVVTGTPRIRQVLTASTPTWTPSGVTTTYAWLRDGTEIGGATASTYTLTADDVGARISVRATGTKTGCTSGSSRSADTAVVDRLPSTLTLIGSSPDVGQARIAVGVSATGATRIGGAVDVYDGTYLVATGLTVVDGATAFAADGLAAGEHTFRIAYRGDPSVAPAELSTTIVVADALSAGLTVSASSDLVGVLALAVDVQAAGEPAAGGTVDVREGSRTLRSGIAVSDGTARYEGTKITPGRHTYTVRYSGTSRVKASSTTITTTVKAKAKPVLKVRGSSPTKGRVTLTVAVTAKGHATVGGTVKITEGTKVRKAKLTIVKGKARWTATKVKKGKHRYTVTYRGTSQIASVTAKRTVKVR